MKKLERYLPADILGEIRQYGSINEIRLKRNSRIVLKKDKQTIILNKQTDDTVFDLILDNLLEHSYHSKLHQLVDGYISVGDAYRVGIAGRAVLRDGTVTNLSEIGSVNIRIPYLIKGVSVPVIRYLEAKAFSRGVLIYSRPGVGKTTLLRDIIIRLCSSPLYKRVSVIDTRNEIYTSHMSCLPTLDLYSGYPKHIGIEQAIRTMSPDFIICDEIGNEAETEAILSNQSCGVPIIATAHGDNFTELKERKNIKRMDESGVFGCYIGINRQEGSDRYDFDFTER